jgi:hypothetical protein
MLGNTRTYTIAGIEAEPNLFVSFTWNAVNPTHRPQPYRKGAGNPQGELLVERVEDGGKSEGSAVMAGIGDHAPLRKQAHFHLVQPSRAGGRVLYGVSMAKTVLVTVLRPRTRG